MVGRKVHPVFLVLALFIACVSFAFGEEPPPHTITVTGDAEVKVTPDQAILSLGVETYDMTQGIAKKQNDDAMKKIIATAKEKGIAAKDIQTDYISIEPLTSSNGNERLFLGYRVRNSLRLTINDMSKLEDIYSSALDAGANVVQGVEFLTTELRKHRDEARGRAVKAAKEKAEALAKELGLGIGKARTILEGTSPYSYNNYNWRTPRQVAVGGNLDEYLSGLTMSPGVISVTASITVTFDLL